MIQVPYLVNAQKIHLGNGSEEVITLDELNSLKVGDLVKLRKEDQSFWVELLSSKGEGVAPGILVGVVTISSIKLNDLLNGTKVAFFRQNVLDLITIENKYESNNN